MNRTDRAIVRFTVVGHGMFHPYELAIPLFIVYWLGAFDVSVAVIGTVVGGLSFGYFYIARTVSSAAERNREKVYHRCRPTSK